MSNTVTKPEITYTGNIPHKHYWDFAGRKEEHWFNGLTYTAYVICHECGAIEERTVKSNPTKSI